ncbi:DUF3558 domain-containing protein [Nocardia jiangxiensis]|uniref:DUF3558 domain-containing protein n=1 Tax=Nocardia jiangxiensis TaxID=282685 RepID=A0ABW6SDN1_9NOCA
MTRQMHKIWCTAAAVGTAVLLAGCQNGGGGASATSPSAASAPSTIAPDVPTSFNGCQLPQSVIDAEHLGYTGTAPMKSDAAVDGGIKWRGCIWTTYEGDGYSANVRTTNLTIPMIEANKGFTIAERVTVGGRQALTYHKSDDTDLRADCLLNAEMKGGTLELQIDNPASNKVTGTHDSCKIVEKLTGELVATFPPSA